MAFPMIIVELGIGLGLMNGAVGDIEVRREVCLVVPFELCKATFYPNGVK